MHSWPRRHVPLGQEAHLKARVEEPSHEILRLSYWRVWEQHGRWAVMAESSNSKTRICKLASIILKSYVITFVNFFRGRRYLCWRNLSRTVYVVVNSLVCCISTRNGLTAAGALSSDFWRWLFFNKAVCKIENNCISVWSFERMNEWFSFQRWDSSHKSYEDAKYCSTFIDEILLSFLLYKLLLLIFILTSAL